MSEAKRIGKYGPYAANEREYQKRWREANPDRQEKYFCKTYTKYLTMRGYTVTAPDGKAGK